MEKTIKEMAIEMQIDKQQIYRYIKKNHINEVHQNHIKTTSVKQYNEIAQRQIKQGIFKNELHQKSHHEVHQNHITDVVYDVLLKQSEMFQKELEEKNKQINEMQKLLDQEQQLRMAEHQRVLQLEEKKMEKNHWWNKK